jgi:GrpB-like predicted nucleotidyltransferase (UPF0157 family)
VVRRVILVPYDPAWPRLYEEEAALWRRLLGGLLVDVAHIGSTAVPGLLAKPTIDLLITVLDVPQLDGLNEALTAAGYLPRGEHGIPGRRYFVRGTPERHTHHAHAFAVGSPEVARHLAFRDYLRAHPADAAAYARLKERLARRFPADPAAYTDGKGAFIRRVEARALAWREGGGEERQD